MIRQCIEKDFDAIYEVINDSAQAYKGIIPDDRWHEPYMPKDALKIQIMDGVQFWGYFDNNYLTGVMGIQQKGDVTLIRHSYVRTKFRNKGIGNKLINYLCELTEKPILIGTWSDAKWAISFYEKHGFRLVSYKEKEILLRKYWSIPERQIETSVVLADNKWKNIY